VLNFEQYADAFMLKLIREVSGNRVTVNSQNTRFASD
jgi:hypothetical protein